MMGGACVHRGWMAGNVAWRVRARACVRVLRVVKQFKGDGAGWGRGERDSGVFLTRGVALVTAGAAFGALSCAATAVAATDAADGMKSDDADLITDDAESSTRGTGPVRPSLRICAN